MRVRTGAFALGAVGALAAGTLAVVASAPVAAADLTCGVHTWGFGDVSDLTFNGTATTTTTSDGTVLRLTASEGGQGSAYTSGRVPIDDATSFSTSFSFRISGQTGGEGEGADGLMFVVQSQGSDALGADGGGLSFGSVEPSIGVEFDTWDNGAWDVGNDDNFYTPANHAGIDVNGDLLSDPRVEMPWSLSNPAAVHHVWVDYDGATDRFEVRLAQTATRPASPLLTKVVDLPALLGPNGGYMGFSSGTGALAANHDVLDWELDSCIEAVEPAPVPTVTVGDRTVVEGSTDHIVGIPVQLSSASPSGTTVTGVVTGGGTRVPNQTVTVTIPAGQSAGELPVQVVGNTVDEPDQTASIALTSATGGTLDSPPDTATLTVQDDDDPAPPPPPAGPAPTRTCKLVKITVRVGLLMPIIVCI